MNFYGVSFFPPSALFCVVAIHAFLFASPIHSLSLFPHFINYKTMDFASHIHIVFRTRHKLHSNRHMKLLFRLFFICSRQSRTIESTTINCIKLRVQTICFFPSKTLHLLVCIGESTWRAEINMVAILGRGLGNIIPLSSCRGCTHAPSNSPPTPFTSPRSLPIANNWTLSSSASQPSNYMCLLSLLLLLYLLALSGCHNINGTHVRSERPRPHLRLSAIFIL